MEVLHESSADASAWMRPEAMADLLGVSGRTVRTMVQRGQLVRMRAPDGKVYVRQESPTGSDRPPEGWKGDPKESEGSPDVILRTQLVELTHAHRAETRRLRDALQEALLAAERRRSEVVEARLLADVATRDVGRAREAAEAAQAALATERLRRQTAERYAAALATVPWYAFRQRARLRDQLAGVDRLGLPAAVA